MYRHSKVVNTLAVHQTQRKELKVDKLQAHLFFSYGSSNSFLIKRVQAAYWSSLGRLGSDHDIGFAESAFRRPGMSSSNSTFRKTGRDDLRTIV